MCSRTWQAAEPWADRLSSPSISSSNAVWPPAVPSIGFAYSPIQHWSRQVGIIDDQPIARHSEIQSSRKVNAVELGAIAIIVAMAFTLTSVVAWLMFG
jgi:hypothetical protein